jgi:hypothetical protein
MPKRGETYFQWIARRTAIAEARVAAGNIVPQETPLLALLRKQATSEKQS